MDYSKFLNLAERLISGNGCNMILRRIYESGAIDVKTGKRELVFQDSEFIGVISQPTQNELQAGYFKDVSLLVLASGRLAPVDLTDTIIIEGKEYNIEEIRQVMPGGGEILYKLGLLGGARINND